MGEKIKMVNYDFSGWATKNNLKCSDGRTIMKNAFEINDGQTVPLVWNHQHNDPDNILGHALLENREEGVYARCVFNNSVSGQKAKLLVQHGDVCALSIYANQLKQQGANVLHGNIREVSLVLAGANPGASIDSVVIHGQESEDEAIIYTGEDISLEHSDSSEKTVAPSDDETVKDVFNSLNEKQKTVVYAMIGQALANGDESDNKEDDSKGGNDTMKHNVFDQNNNKDQQNVLSHSEMMDIIGDAKRFGSLKESAIQHSVTNIDYLFPDAQTVTPTPTFISRDMGWVAKVMASVHHTPFSRIKSTAANITEDDARAKGYIKGSLKKDEVFTLLKRTTSPVTVYKKQKIDRDDLIDITDFDVVAWIKSEMRMMLDEEIARAVLVSDGRSGASEDKIHEDNIRPIWTDDDLYTIKQVVTVTSAATDDQKAKAFIRAAIKSRKAYKGSGNPTLYTTEDVLTDCLLLEDATGRAIYDTVQKLATALRVSEIVTVPVMEGLKRTVDGTERNLLGIIVNLYDYNIGADKGGAVNLFDDFDIDYNAQKYLIETRCSGALVKPYSAIALEQVVGE